MAHKKDVAELTQRELALTEVCGLICFAASGTPETRREIIAHTQAITVYSDFDMAVVVKFISSLSQALMPQPTALFNDVFASLIDRLEVRG